jgi:hypothetical protein
MTINEYRVCSIDGMINGIGNPYLEKNKPYIKQHL